MLYEIHSKQTADELIVIVLILVLLENALRAAKATTWSRANTSSVLILVLLENALRVVSRVDEFENASLNPCFVGKCSTRVFDENICLMLDES